jgi:hypothetical protein
MEVEVVVVVGCEVVAEAFPMMEVAVHLLLFVHSLLKKQLVEYI